MTKRFLGWDCANKTLAWSYFDIDTHIYSKMVFICDNLVQLMATYMGKDIARDFPHLSPIQREIFSDCVVDPDFLDELCYILDAANYFLDGFITYHSSGVADVLEGRNVDECDEIARTHALNKFLMRSDVSSCSPDTQCIIEHQPSKVGTKTNNKSTMVGHQLMFYYAAYNPVIVNPKLKNNLTLREGLSFAKFLEVEMAKGKSKKDASYPARKKHSKASLIHLLNTFNCSHVLDTSPKSCWDDLADSSMQVLAWMIENKKFI